MEDGRVGFHSPQGSAEESKRGSPEMTALSLLDFATQ